MVSEIYCISCIKGDRMAAVMLRPQPDRRAVPFFRSLILSLFLISITIRGDFISAIVKDSNINPFLLIVILRIIGTALLLTLTYLWGYTIESLGLARGKIKKGVKHATIWCLGFGFVIALIAGIIYLKGIIPFSLFANAGDRDAGYLIAYFLVGCFIGPMVEDMTFVGLLYNSLRIKLNLILSALVVALLFALCHLQLFPFHLSQFSPFLVIQFVGGLLFTTSFEFSESLITPMIIHICGNCAITLISLI